MKPKDLAIGLLSLGLAVGMAGCGKGPFGKTADNEKNKKDKTPEAIPVEVTALVRGPIQTVLGSSSNLEAEQAVKVYARTSNRVTELLVEEGDHVEKGQVLIRLDDDVQRTAFDRAENNLDKARKEFVRQKALFEQQLISEKSFTDVQFELRQLELALEDAQRQLEYTEVRAPISGTLSLRLVNLGDLVNANQHLFDLVDFDSIVTRIYLPEKELPLLAVGQTTRVTSTSLPGQEFEGYVKRIAPVVESRTGTVKVTIGFKNVEQLRPGMYVNAEIVTATKDDALLISKRSLVHDAEQVFAYRLRTNRTVERLLVQPNLSDDFNVEPVDGFAEGDLLVVAGQTGLKDGAKVRLPGDPDPKEKKKDSAKDAEQPGAGDDPALADGQTDPDGAHAVEQGTKEDAGAAPATADQKDQTTLAADSNGAA